MKTTLKFIVTIFLIQLAVLLAINERGIAQTSCIAIEGEIYKDASGNTLSTPIPIIQPLSFQEIQNRQILNSFGIGINKCPCPDSIKFQQFRLSPNDQEGGCTSVGGLQPSTLSALVDFSVLYSSTASNSTAVMITGGSELGHKSIEHSEGLKVDLAVNQSLLFNDPLSQFIIKDFGGYFDFLRFRTDATPEYGLPRVGNPEDGTPTGPIFGLEFAIDSNHAHWDVLFPPGLSSSTLVTDTTGNGGGLVTQIPIQVPFLFCGTDCTRYTAGISAKLIAVPDNQSVFGGWTGVDVQQGLSASVKVVGNKNVSAEFDSLSSPPPPGNPPPGNPPSAGNPACWTWFPNAMGSGGWMWTCASTPPPSPTTNSEPTGACFHWDAKAGFGGWIVDVCGGTNRGAVSSVTVTGTTSHDPNEKLGTQGVGTQQYLQRNQALRYAVFFSNLETATAPAQEIMVTDQLDLAHDELATFSLGPVAFGNILISPPVGASTLRRIVDLRPGNNLLVKVEASLDGSTGLVTWRFTSLDPATGQPPLDPSAGFLPPGGEGSVFFTVMPKAGTPTNTQINNQATIVFDANAPLPTQTWSNTVDNDKPQSHMLSLPAQSSTSIPLQWAGTDLGAGVQDFTVYVSGDGGPFVPFVTQSSATSAAFLGQPGHTYGFFSKARDFVGNVEDLKTTAEATTIVVTDAIPPTTLAVLAPPANANGWNKSNISINLSSTDNSGGSGVQQITFNATGAQSIATANVLGSSASALISTEGITNFSFFATDLAANVETAQTLVIKLDKTPPSITGARTPMANANGWNNTDVTVSFACSDVLSGLAPGSPPGTALVSSEGVNQQVPGVCLDLAGNAASATVSGINIDKTPPSIAPSRTPAANANGWNNTNVTVSFACADALSGLALGSPPAATVLSSEGTNQQVSGTCIDLAGNSALAAASGINIDKTRPVLSGLPAAGCTLWPPDKKFVTVATISAVDVLSGLASFNVTGTSDEPQDPNDPDIIISGTGLGPRTVQLRADRLGTGTGRIYTITSTATDAAGNVVNSSSTCVVPHDQAP